MKTAFAHVATQLRGSPREGLFGATLGFFFGFAAVSLYGPAATRFEETMALSAAMVGLLVAMPNLTGSILRIPFSAWVESTGGRKPFLTLLVLSITGMAGLFLVLFLLYPDQLSASYYPLLLLLGALSGCGIATFSVGISQVAYWFPQARQGRALGTYAGVGNLAPGLFAFLIPIALASWGITHAYLAWLVFLVLGTALYYVTGKNAWYFQLRNQGISSQQAREIAQGHGQELFPAANPMESLKISAGVWKTWTLVVLYFTTFGGFLALTTWLPTYWGRYFALSATLAGSLTAAYSLLASAIRVPGGSLADRLGGERTALLALGALLAGAVGMTLAQGVSLALPASMLMAIGMGINNAAVFKLVPQEVPQAVGGAAGWVGGLGAFGGFAIPPVMGAFVDLEGTIGYAHGFVVFIGLALLSLGLAYALRRSSVPRPPGRALESSEIDSR